MERRYIILLMLLLICIGFSFVVFYLERIRIDHYLQQEIAKAKNNSYISKEKLKQKRIIEICGNGNRKVTENHIDCA